MIQAPKPQFKNMLLIGVFLLLLLTPLGKTLKLEILQLISTSPSVVNIENQQVLTNYSGTISDENGTIIPFESFRNKIVIIGFWATWCPSCIAEMPSLQKLYNDYKNDVSFVLITNEETEKVRKFMLKKNYDLPVFYNERNLPNELFSKSIPATFLISSEGKIIIKKIGTANWNSHKVRETLDNLLAQSQRQMISAK